MANNTQAKIALVHQAAAKSAASDTESRRIARKEAKVTDSLSQEEIKALGY